MSISIALKKLSMATAGAAFIGLGTVSAAPADAYTFTKIADNKGSFSSFFDGPAINNSGTVAFGANLDAGGSGIFTSNGITTTTIADTNSTFTSFGDVSINDLGTVAFQAGFEIDRVGIFTSNGTTTTTIAIRDLYPSNSFFSSVSSPVINNSGTVVYLFDNSPFGGGVRTGNGTSVDDDNSGSGNRFVIYNSPDINDAGTVAYITSGFGNHLVIGNTDINAYQHPFGIFTTSAINNQGTVVVRSGNLDWDTTIFTISNATQFTTIADISGPFSYFDTVSINDAGTIAFLADLDVEGRGIFTGTNPLTDKVIAVGDTLFDSTVQGLGFFREGLNNSGQIAFYASLADGTQGIFRADPDPVPQSVPEHTGGLTLLAFGDMGAGAVLKRKQKRLFNSTP